MNETEQALHHLDATLRASTQRIADDWARVGDALAKGMGLNRCDTCQQFQHPINPHRHTVSQWFIAKYKRGNRR